MCRGLEVWGLVCNLSGRLRHGQKPGRGSRGSAAAATKSACSRDSSGLGFI